MSGSLEAVRTVLNDANINAAVDLALADDRDWYADLPPNIRAGSPLFNAYTVACNEIALDPDIELVDHEVVIPEDISWLGATLIKLANQSFTRDASASIDLWLPSSASGIESHCESADAYFYEGLGHTNDDNDIIIHRRKHTVHSGGDSEAPVLFTKGRYAKTSIGLQEIAINGISYPIGTIYTLDQVYGQGPVTQTKQVDVFDLSNINGISALRLGEAAVPTYERAESVFSEMDEENPPIAPENLSRNLIWHLADPDLVVSPQTAAKTVS